MSKNFITTLVVLCLFATVSFAQEAVVSGTESQQGVEDSATTKGNVSLDFREADIRNVFKILAFKSGTNIVASPEVTGVISIQLTDVPWQQALDVIVQTYGYAYEKRGTIVVVMTVEDMKKRREDNMLLAEQEPLETRTYILNFGKASEIIASIEKMKSDRGSINFDERTNTIIATDTARFLPFSPATIPSRCRSEIKNSVS